MVDLDHSGEIVFGLPNRNREECGPDSHHITMSWFTKTVKPLQKQHHQGLRCSENEVWGHLVIGDDWLVVVLAEDRENVYCIVDR